MELHVAVILHFLNNGSILSRYLVSHICSVCLPRIWVCLPVVPVFLAKDGPRTVSRSWPDCERLVTWEPLSAMVSNINISVEVFATQHKTVNLTKMQLDPVWAVVCRPPAAPPRTHGTAVSAVHCGHQPAANVAPVTNWVQTRVTLIKYNLLLMSISWILVLCNF